MQIILCIELISLHVRMFIPCVNDHCGQAMLYCFIPFCLIALCLLHMHFKFSAYNDRIVLLFLGNTYPYGSKASQILLSLPKTQGIVLIYNLPFLGSTLWIWGLGCGCSFSSYHPLP